MPKSAIEAIDELRHEWALVQERVERLRADGDLAVVDNLEQWIVAAQKVIARWDGINGR